MPHPKRFLPPMTALRALESFERTGSVTQTGLELGVSQSAVSRQLRVLEDHLDTPLFTRDRKTIRLSLAARDYCTQVRAALEQIGTASLRLKANPRGGQLNIAMLPAFGVRWLAPRLPDFVERHPEFTVNLSTRLKPFDFASEPFHGAIHFGQRDWSDVAYQELMREYVVPVASPKVAHTLRGSTLSDLFSLPLLHLDTRPDAWEKWAQALGKDIECPVGMLFDQFASMIQAAIHGMGAALLPTYLVENELEDGRLVALWPESETSIGAYYFVWPIDEPNYQPRDLFVDWLRQVKGGTVPHTFAHQTGPST
ncbi:LysR family transcriptional regulator [Thioclava dalianensis]|uniref:LysR family transcriptional regulator n=2 Tax=Thioclava dalianensis TaxID=1185766 RepID=A0A074TKX3_9RHOB|nr:LysR family transcriptional regulator [Thioclava dalianensis]KEP70800.1 LysR family transcriptional regulator [Thioclava dalianensis]SFN11119.1 LysR family transcriptional regulator, glycine cleavage system transcriptional activator [Thioclava dalianensis]